MEKFNYRGKEFQIKYAKHVESATISTDDFHASIGELKALSIYATGIKYQTEVSGYSPHTVKNYMRNLVKRNSTEEKKADGTHLAVKAERYGLLYPLTLAGLGKLVHEHKHRS